MATLFRDVRIFDGKGSELSAPCHVLVEGNTIARISQEPIPVEGEVSVIEGRGRTLMPGLIDAHWHTMLCGISMEAGLMADVGFVNLLAGRMAEATLIRGFTAVRDLGGPSFGLKMAIDKGLVAGPRIWPAGAFITQTGGHGDFRLPIDIPRWGNQPHYIELIGLSAIVDSPDQVRLRAREQLAKGACFLKLTAGGGISSHYDPIDVAQFTEAELRAAVEAAENWNTYVAVHVYTPRAIRQAIEAGVRSIEHGHLVDEATVELMAERGVWWSLQPFLPEHAKPPPIPADRQSRRRCTRAPTARTSWPSSTASRPLGAPTSSSTPSAPRSRTCCWWSCAAGTRRPRCCAWPPRSTPSCWPSLAPAPPTRASWAWWRRARWPTCCWWTATPWPTST